MAPTTTGFNSTEQANAFLDGLRIELAALGVARVTRGRLWKLPDRPCAVLVGPRINMGILGLHVEDARFDWLLVIARDVADLDRRDDELDTWADTAAATIMDVAYTSSVCDVLGGEGPDRDATPEIAEFLQRHSERIDATVVSWSTRRQIRPPCA